MLITCNPVVSYRNSTSNHNVLGRYLTLKNVVSYRNSTSNHNLACTPISDYVLYLIEILHQTTTKRDQASECLSCILSKFYIKPQRDVQQAWWLLCCILSKFYIKPQRLVVESNSQACCILSKFYIKPQLTRLP